MLRKVLAIESGREITAEFKNEAEYNAYCRKVINDCLDICLSSLSLEEVVKLWENCTKNRHKIHNSVILQRFSCLQFKQRIVLFPLSGFPLYAYRP